MDDSYTYIPPKYQPLVMITLLNTARGGFLPKSDTEDLLEMTEQIQTEWVEFLESETTEEPDWLGIAANGVGETDEGEDA